MSSSVLGRIHSFQTLGTVDGPGIRFVVFMQGCNLRCGCCHNPDTWEKDAGELYTPEEVYEKMIRYKDYFGKYGGITVSGGEPLLQPEFVKRLFVICHQNGINTCLDTSGSVLNNEIKAILAVTDRVLLDIKYTNDIHYQQYVGCSIKAPLDFLAYLQSINLPVTIRQVIIPTLNNHKENVCELKRIANTYKCVDKIELLPFKKICQVKYDSLNIPFRFSHIPEPKREDMLYLESLLQ